MPDLVQELQFNCGRMDIFVDIYSGEKIAKAEQQELAEILKTLGGYLNLQAGRIRILVHDLGRGLNGILVSAEVFGKCHAYTSSATPSSRAESVSGVIGSCLIAIKTGLEVRETATNLSESDDHDPVMGRIGDPVPVDEILEGFRRDQKGGQN